MSCNCDIHGPYRCIDIVPIFQHLSKDEVLEIASITNQRDYKKGETLYRVGEKRGELFVLHKGSVKIIRLTYDGKEQIVRIVRSGQFLGEINLFSHSEQTDSAVALEDTEVCLIEWQALKKLMEKIPSIAFKVMEQLSLLLEETQKKLEETTFHSVEQRLATYLLDLSKKSDIINLELSKGDLASLLGTTLETLSRRLSTFVQQEIISLSGQRGITILDRQALMDYAQQL